MPNHRTPTYDDLSALFAQMAAALEKLDRDIFHDPQEIERAGQFRETIESALAAYRTLSPDPKWQKVTKMLPPLKRLAAIPVEQDFAIGNDRGLVLYKNAGKSITIGDVLDARAALEGLL